MNEFRKRLLGGGKPEGSLLRAKEPKAAPSRAAEDETFVELAIPRAAGRQADHRDGDRHRLSDEFATLTHGGEQRDVVLINLSGGGAMIEPAGTLKLWDAVELQLGRCDKVEAIVRWIKGERVGLEFAHETRIGGSSDEIASTLSAVIRRSFPDVVLEAAATAAAQEAGALAPEALDIPPVFEGDSLSEREIRHPLIWTGLVHYNHDSTPVRLRNISSGGALIESSGAFPIGAELLLDLGEAGAIFGSVHWARGDQAGIKFHSPYNLGDLAKARPEVAGVRWKAPDYLREDLGGNSPWSSQWGRSDLAEVHRALELTRSRIRRR
jgi:hypothetical protein